MAPLPSDLPLQCPRCGFYPLVELDLCWRCADGVADAERARRLVTAASDENQGAVRILGEVCDRRALPVLLAALGKELPGRARRAVITAAGNSGRGDPAAVDAIRAELKNEDPEIAESAVKALADVTVDRSTVNNALAEAMRTRPDLQMYAAVVLAWRHDLRALPLLENHLATQDWSVMNNLYNDCGPMLGRLGLPGRAALARLLAGVLAAHPDPPPFAWRGVDHQVREILRGLLGHWGEPDPDALATARRLTADYPWAGDLVGAVLAERSEQPYPGQPPRVPIDPTMRVVPRWGMRLRRVGSARPGPTTRFGGQPYFRGERVWPLHPNVGLPLTFLGQIAVPATVAGDGSWLAHIFIDLALETFVGDPDANLGWAPGAVVVHPRGRWWGPTDARLTGPTCPHEWPDEWPSRNREWERLLPGPQFRFIVSEVDLVLGADPDVWPRDTYFESTNDDWCKVGGTPLTLQQGEGSFMERGWKFLASFGAAEVGCEMGDAAHCYVWVHPDGRGALQVDSH